MNYKQCTKCKEAFPASPEYFHKDKTTGDGYNRQCKECVNSYQREREIREKEDLKRKHEYLTIKE